MLARLSLFPLFICLFYLFYLFIHLEPFGDAHAAAQPSAARAHYCVSIDESAQKIETLQDGEMWEFDAWR